MKNSPIGFLSSNAVKLIAVIFMTVDHVGMLLFPQVKLLRIIGRLAMPLFAYMISESCRYTKSKGRFLLRLFLLGSAFQVVYVIFEGDMFFNVFITFSLAVALCGVCDAARELASRKKHLTAFLTVLAAALCLWALTYGVNLILPVRISFDGGVFGILLPVFIYLAPNFPTKLLAMAAGCLLIAVDFGGRQYWCILSVLIVLFYNGERGRLPLKSFFYVYYPAHLAFLYGLDYVLEQMRC